MFDAPMTDTMTDAKPRKYRPTLFDEIETKQLVAASSYAGILPHEFVKASVSAAIMSMRERNPAFDAYLSLL